MIPKQALDSTKIFHPELCKGKVCLITGGSNGGMLKQIARAFLLHGATAVGLVARNAANLAKVVDEL
jgi:NAD(P)-dependent dehydrogenase (short-subunit alcohol dehydrogenase family)